jgi:hypothetical protein
VAGDANKKVGCVDWGAQQSEGFESSMVPVATLSRIADAVDKRLPEEKRKEETESKDCTSVFNAVTDACKKRAKRPMTWSCLNVTACKHGAILAFGRLPLGEEHSYLWATDLETKAKLGIVNLEVKDISCRTEQSYKRMDGRAAFLRSCWNIKEYKNLEDQADAEALAPYWGVDYRAIAARPCPKFPNRCLQTVMESVKCIDEFHLHCHQSSCWYKYGVYESARKYDCNERGEPSKGSDKPGTQCESSWINAPSLR